MKKLCYIKQVLMVRLKMKICHCLLFKVKVKSLSHVRPFATPRTVAHQAPPSMGFSRQEGWSGLPLPSPGDLPDPGNEPRSPALPLLTMPKPLTVWITINGNILQEIGIPDHLTHLLRNLLVGRKATVRTGHGTTDWFQIRKRVCQGCILSPCLFICRVHHEKLGWKKHKLASRLPGEISITSDIQMTPPL